MKKIYLFPAIFFFAGLLSIAGCTHYPLRIPSLPLRGADLYPGKQQKDGLIIAADDYFDEEKSNQTFGLNFSKENILVVEVIISNRSNTAYMVQSNEVILLKGDQVMYPLLASEVSSDKQINEYLNMIELRDMVINPGESGQGFLYFRLPEGSEENKDTFFSAIWPQDEYRLRVGATQVEDNSRLIYTVYLRNM